MVWQGDFREAFEEAFAAVATDGERVESAVQLEQFAITLATTMRIMTYSRQLSRAVENAGDLKVRQW